MRNCFVPFSGLFFFLQDMVETECVLKMNAIEYLVLKLQGPGQLTSSVQPLMEIAAAF